MADGFFIQGIPELFWNIEKETDAILKRLASTLYQEALRILEIAKSRVPVKTGALRASGKVHPPVITKNEVSVMISFGDETVTWAVPVHERMYVKHVTGQAKYLESVILEEMKGLERKLAVGR